MHHNYAFLWVLLLLRGNEIRFYRAKFTKKPRQQQAFSHQLSFHVHHLVKSILLKHRSLDFCQLYNWYRPCQPALLNLFHACYSLLYLFHILIIFPAIACIPSYMTRILLLPHTQTPLYGREKSTKERMATRPLRLV